LYYEEFKRELEREVRMIGDYSAVELQKFKDLYKETGGDKRTTFYHKKSKIFEGVYFFFTRIAINYRF